MEVLLVLSTGIICLLAFYFGSIIGKGEKIPDQAINLPSPIKAYREHKEKEKLKKEQEKDDIIAHNINIYDGTENGQRDIPQ